jgi:hypothetical protein
LDGIILIDPFVCSEDSWKASFSVLCNDVIQPFAPEAVSYCFFSPLHSG